MNWTNEKLTTGKTYYYKVCGYSLVNGKVVKGGCSAVVSAKPALSKVSLSSVQNREGKKVELNWKKVEGASGYVIYRATSKNGTYEKVKTVSSKNLKWTDSSLKNGKTYYYKVRAYRTVSGSNVYGSYSAVKQVTIKK